MIATLSPTAALRELINLDKRAARILLAGLGALAAAAIAVTWGIVGDFQTIWLMAAYIIGLGFVLIILANVLHHSVWSFVLGGFFTLLIIATVTAFFISAVFRQQGIINPTYCLVKFWEVCADREATVLARNPSAVEVAAVRPAEVRAATEEAPGLRPAEYRVHVQFAGLIAREKIVSLNRALLAAGWQVQGLRGERTSAAQGVNEVRYGRPEDEQAARALANAVTAAGIGSGPLDIQLNPRIGSGPLEIWVSK